MKEHELRAAVLCRPDLSAQDKITMLGIMMCVDWDQWSGSVSRRDIKNRTGQSVSAIKRSIKVLVDIGLITHHIRWNRETKLHDKPSIKIIIGGVQVDPTPVQVEPTPVQVDPTPPVQVDPTPRFKLNPLSIKNNNNNNKSNKEGDLKIDWDQFKHLSKAEYEDLPPEGQQAYQTKAILCSGWKIWQFDEFLEEFYTTMETRQ